MILKTIYDIKNLMINFKNRLLSIRILVFERTLKNHMNKNIKMKVLEFLKIKSQIQFNHRIRMKRRTNNLLRATNQLRIFLLSLNSKEKVLVMEERRKKKR
jgi:hypothetical protein